MKRLLIIVFSLLVLMITPALAWSPQSNNAQVNLLYHMGYSALIWSGEPGYVATNAVLNDQTFTGPYNYDGSGKLVTDIDVIMKGGTNEIGGTCNYALLLADGTTVRGTYSNVDGTNFSLSMNGQSVSGILPNLDLEHQISSYLDNLISGQNKGADIDFEIMYARQYNDSSKYYLYAYCNNQVILQPIQSESDYVTSFSLNSNVQIETLYTVNNNASWINANAGNVGQGNYDLNQTSTNLVSLVTGKISDYVGLLFTVSSGMISLVMMIFAIIAFILNPLNLILIIMQFEGISAIIALSGRGDIFRSLQSFAKANASFFGFMVTFAKASVSVLSFTVQALAAVAGAAAQAAQPIANTLVSGIGGLLLLLK